MQVVGIDVVPMGTGVDVAVRVTFLLGLVVVLEAVRTEQETGPGTQTEHDQSRAEVKPDLSS